MVVAGWLGIVYTRVLFTFCPGGWAQSGTWLKVADIGQFLFFISPLPFAALCWNSVDTRVLRLLARQTQYWTVLLLVAGMVGVNLWAYFITPST